ELETFIADNHITEVECIVPDINGIARGKILPDEKFLDGLTSRGMRIPEAIFVQTVTGDYPADEDVTDDAVIDVYMVPDADSIR
ncbi:glutamine synthetase, partial [Paraburkholderia sp. SIMBA_061]